MPNSYTRIATPNLWTLEARLGVSTCTNHMEPLHEHLNEKQRPNTVPGLIRSLSRLLELDEATTTAYLIRYCELTHETTDTIKVKSPMSLSQIKLAILAWFTTKPQISTITYPLLIAITASTIAPCNQCLPNLFALASVCKHVPVLFWSCTRNHNRVGHQWSGNFEFLLVAPCSCCIPCATYCPESARHDNMHKLLEIVAKRQYIIVFVLAFIQNRIPLKIDFPTLTVPCGIVMGFLLMCDIFSSQFRNDTTRDLT